MDINATLFVQAIVFAIFIWFTMKYIWHIGILAAALMMGCGGVDSDTGQDGSSALSPGEAGDQTSRIDPA